MNCQSCGAQVAGGTAFCSKCGRPIAGFSVGQATASGGAAAYAMAGGGAELSASAYGSYAGFWLRFVAALIDGIVVTVPTMILYFIVMASAMSSIVRSQGNPPNPQLFFTTMLPRMLAFNAFSVVAQWLYFALMESSSWQATLGKRALGLYVTDLSGQPISFARASGRFFAKFISAMTLLIGYLLAGFTEKKQALHDMIAGCLVMKRS